MQEIKEDLKEIKADLKIISDTMHRNTASLEVHEARSTASEKRIDMVERLVLGLMSGGLLAFIIHSFTK